MSSRAGYVLAGGKSSRMGRDKALLPVRDHTLIDVVREAVRAAAGTAWRVGGPQADVPDRYPGEGPLGGILTTLGDTTADWNLVVACDMPALTVEFLVRLLDAAERSGGEALIPAGPSGRPEPLCAAYHRDARAGMEQAFERGERQITRALAEVRAVAWHVAEVACFQNINTPEEWAAYER